MADVSNALAHRLRQCAEASPVVDLGAAALALSDVHLRVVGRIVYGDAADTLLPQLHRFVEQANGLWAAMGNARSHLPNGLLGGLVGHEGARAAARAVNRCMNREAWREMDKFVDE